MKACWAPASITLRSSLPVDWFAVVLRRNTAAPTRVLEMRGCFAGGAVALAKVWRSSGLAGVRRKHYLGALPAGLSCDLAFESDCVVDAAETQQRDSALHLMLV